MSTDIDELERLVAMGPEEASKAIIRDLRSALAALSKHACIHCLTSDHTTAEHDAAAREGRAATSRYSKALDFIEAQEWGAGIAFDGSGGVSCLSCGTEKGHEHGPACQWLACMRDGGRR